MSLKICAIAVIALAMPAQAAFVAERDIIGFSADERYFAFEEFGVQDGSGFPFSNIFIIDTLNDTWVGGSPFRVMIQDETAPLSAARDEAMSDSAAALSSLGVSAGYALVASNPPTELNVNPRSISFKPRPVLVDIDPPVTLKLVTFPLAGPELCEGLGDTQGFALTMSVSGNEAVEVYRDESLPDSRGCPLDYSIADIVVPQSSETWRGVAIISVFAFGFEGRDRRLIAVPIPLEAK